VGVHGVTENGLHRDAWRALAHELRLTELAVRELVVSAGSLADLDTFLRS